LLDQSLEFLRRQFVQYATNSLVQILVSEHIHTNITC